MAAVKAAMEAERLSAAAAAAAAAAASSAAVKEPAAGEEALEAAGVDEGSVEMADYLVYCVTGDCQNAGTNANIHISVVGQCSVGHALQSESKLSFKFHGSSFPHSILVISS